MSTIAEPIAGSKVHYLNADYGIKSWLLTTDHKRIALLYLIGITFFFFIGGAFAVLLRLELITPQGDMVQPETYNKMFTMHGVMMVFFFLIPSIPAVLGNFLVPLMIGARDLAFPRINLLSWYIYISVACSRCTPIVAGGVDTGWTFYTPYSSTYSNTHVIATASAYSSRLLVDPHRPELHRHHPQDARPGLTWFRLPLFIWSKYATSLIQVLGTPVVAITHRSGRPWNAASASASSIPHRVAIRSCSSTCSGSTRIRPSTS